MAGLLEGNSGSKTQGMGTEPRLDPGLTWVSSCCAPKLPAHWVQVTSLAPAVPACRHPESPLPTLSLAHGARDFWVPAAFPLPILLIKN